MNLPAVFFFLWELGSSELGSLHCIHSLPVGVRKTLVEPEFSSALSKLSRLASSIRGVFKGSRAIHY